MRRAASSIGSTWLTSPPTSNQYRYSAAWALPPTARGAFGATVNMQTENISGKAYGRLDLSGGSYGTHKETLSFSTGLLGGHWGLSGTTVTHRQRRLH